MKISFIIPAYNEEAYIGACLDSILEHTKGDFHELIVVDNASTDRTSEIAKQRPRVTVIREDKKGVQHARQRGFLESTGDYLVFLDADSKLHPNWLPVAKRFFEKNPTAVSLSGPYHYYDGSKLANIGMHIVWWICAPLMFRLVGYMVLGGNHLVKKDALRAINGFDETIDFYGDDTNTARRLSAQGPVVFRMDFFIYSSSRRLVQQGLVKTNIIYALNFIWEAFFHQPFSKNHIDIKPGAVLAKEE